MIELLRVCLWIFSCSYLDLGRPRRAIKRPYIPTTQKVLVSTEQSVSTEAAVSRHKRLFSVRLPHISSSTAGSNDSFFFF